MTPKTKKERFPILVSPLWRYPLRVFGVTEETAFAEVDGAKLHVRFGRFDYEFPLDMVEEVRPAAWPVWAGIGPRYWRGTVGLIGTYVNTVEVLFKEPQEIRVLVPLRCERLYLSAEEPGEFIAAVTKRRAMEAAKAA